MNIITELVREAGREFLFDEENLVRDVCTAVLAAEGWDADAEVTVTLTDDARIRELNKDHRGIDKETDVLSFPNISFEGGEDGIDHDAAIKEQWAGCTDPDTGRVLLGDIVLNTEAVKRQAESFGHSEKREFAFLIAHSMLHLIGYDHMLSDEAGNMEKKQEEVLHSLGIGR